MAIGGKSVGMIKGFLLSETSVTVYSAILLTPVVLSLSARFAPTSFAPAWVILVVLAFVLFLLASGTNGYIRAILHGVSIAIFLNAFLSTSIGGRLTAQLSRYTAGGG